MRVYLATWLFENNQAIALTKCAASRRLLSYFHTREKASDFSEYVVTGEVKKNENVLRRGRARN